MKLDLPNNFLETNGSFEHTEFSIDDTAHAFELLLKNLYSNPIPSCVRETISNAWDSHTAAGKQDTPIIVTAPTRLDPTFTVQDFGTGISPEKFKNVVTRIFCSDKTNSDDLIGGYGLGLKSPLAYTDQFTITSVIDGWSRNYGCYISPTGKPMLSMFSEEITETNNGVTIKVPVKSEDIDDFHNAIKNTLTYFSSFKCNLTITQNKVLWENENIQITNKQAYQDCKILALVGCIPYQINPNYINDQIGNKYQWIGNLVLKFNINELSVTPNREELNYNDKTIKAINKKYQTAKAETILNLAKNVSECPTWELACKQYTALYCILEAFKWVNHNTISHPKSPNQGLSKYITLILDNYEIKELTQNRRHVTNIKIETVKTPVIDIMKPIILYWLPAKTKRIHDCIKKANPYIDDAHRHLLLITNTPDVVLQRLTEICSHTVDVKNLSYTTKLLTPNTKLTYRGNILTTKEPIAIQDIDSTIDVYINAVDKSPVSPWENHNLGILKRVLPQKIRHIIYNHKSHNKMLKAKGVPNIEDLTKQIPDLIKNNLETLQRHKQISLNMARYADSLIHAFPEQPPRSKLIKFAHDFYISDYIKDLCIIADTLNINIPTNPEITKELDDIYEQYKFFFEEHINIRNYPKLLTAYDQYLEMNP